MAEIIIESGVVSSGLTVAAGDIVTIMSGGELVSGTVENGGVIRGTFGAKLTDVNADTGAIIDVAYGATAKPATSGMTIQGDATDIAEGALYYNGAAFAGAATAGVLSGVSGTAAWRFNAGTGLTVDNASLTSGTRIYAVGDAVISGTTILTSGDIDLKDTTTGRSVTVGGAGITNATYNVYASAYDTTVSEGGTLRIRPNGYGSNATVNSGGTLIVDSNGAVMSNANFLSGAMGSVWRNGLLSGADIVSGASVIVSGGTLCDAIMSSGAAIAVSNGGLLSGGRIVGGGGFPAAGAQIRVFGGGIASGVVVSAARLIISEGGIGLDNIVSRGGQAVRDGGIASRTIIRGNGWEQVSSGGTSLDAVISASYQSAYAGGYIKGATVSAGKLTAEGTASSVTVKGGYLAVSKGGVANEVYVSEGASAIASSGGTINNLFVSSGATVFASASGIVSNVVVYKSGAAIVESGGKVVGGSVTNSAAQLSVSSGGVAEKIVVAPGTNADCNTLYVFGGGLISNTTQYGGGIRLSGTPEDGDAIARGTIVSGGTMRVISGATVYNTLIGNGGLLQVSRTTCAASGVTVQSGGSVTINTGGSIDTITVSAGGHLRIANAAANTGISGSIILDLTGAAGCDKYMVYSSFNLTKIPVASRIVKASEITDRSYEYYLVERGGATASYYNWTLDISGNAYTWSKGKSVDDPLRNVRYTTTSNAVGGQTDIRLDAALIGSRVIDVVDTAAALATNGTVLNTDDRGAIWTENTTYGDTVYAAEGMTAGNAWLEIDGANVDKALYGAAANQNFTGVVNMKLTDGSIRNLAAGAAAGGTVANVNFTMAGGTLSGAAYAGGFGNVTNEVKTVINDGTLAEGKDFYAGALANYAKTGTTTSVGDISLTVAGGTFGGNIYGASAVKASVAAAHAAGNVTLSITGGETTKGDQACIFAGGYATGSAADAKVYTVGDIDATISGGSWGEAGNGRGFFGGAFASGVTAEAQDVSITVSGGSMGNVYGGGWAQKGGTSIVGDVNISIDGGTITNVFGGGSHSTSGGTTETGDITITVSGGNITGDIYARGQLDGDTTGAASVIFTGANDFDCGVFGYSYVGGAGEGAALSFSGYTGTFSGNVGGFDGITFDDDTAMTLSIESGSVSNGSWEFDLTDRASALAGTSLLTWSTADFANDTIKVSFADDAQAQGGWNIATVAEAFSGTSFDVEIGGAEIASGLAYNQQIASGDYQGWGFDLDSGVLKFKNLA